MTSTLILGIDPGSQYTGFGVIRRTGTELEHVTHGVIALPLKLEFHDRLGLLSNELEALFTRFEPHVAVIERIFLGKNADSAFKLGHARGIAVAAAVRQGAQVCEYAARSVKKGITGNGASSKEQVQLILFAALGLGGQVRADASDALALAYFHARGLQVQEGLRPEVSP